MGMPAYGSVKGQCNSRRVRPGPVQSVFDRADGLRGARKVAASSSEPGRHGDAGLRFRQGTMQQPWDVYQEVLTRPLVIADGYGAPPDGPGWGADLDDAALATYPPSAFTQVESEPSIEL
jgi:hypothetical protein